jgi:hypothetical protein
MGWSLGHLLIRAGVLALHGRIHRGGSALAGRTMGERVTADSFDRSAYQVALA